LATVLTDEEQVKRLYLFQPLESKEDLHAWIKVYLGLDVPDSIVDPESNSSPMDSIWEIYDRCRRNVDDEFDTILSYAARMSFKTLGASILEVLMVFHLGRSVAHMAAIEGQAKKSQQYVKKFLSRPHLREFVVGSNKREVGIVRYQHKRTGVILSPGEWAALPTQVERDLYDEHGNYIVIIICTMAGANSEHVPFMVVDEVDVVSNPAAYEESKAIPDTYEGKLPVTLLTSTRKFSYGLVQDEINRAHETGLQVRHWNIIDVTERCPRSRHAPNQPDVPVENLTKIPIWRSNDTLRALSERDYESLAPDQQEKYVKDEGYEGCLSNCKLFAVCQGRLATKQTSTSPLLKKISQTQKQFMKFSPQMAKAQLLCWKPSTEGLIYPRLDRGVHMLSAAQIAEKITGDEFTKTNPKMTKKELVEFLKTRDVQWYAGMDFGYAHPFAVVIGVRDGSRMFIIDAFSRTEIELGQKLDLCDKRLREYEAQIFPDIAYPSDIATFKKNGYRMKEWSKMKGSVESGIEVVRLKLWPAVGEPELFFIAEDEDVDNVFQHMQFYHWETNPAGKFTTDPAKEDDDECDALRYMVMNVFAPRGRLTVARDDKEPRSHLLPRAVPEQRQVQQQNWNLVREYLGMEADENSSNPDDHAPKPKGKKGNFHWDLS
jgi:hypothetical protein